MATVVVGAIVVVVVLVAIVGIGAAVVDGPPVNSYRIVAFAVMLKLHEREYRPLDDVAATGELSPGHLVVNGDVKRSMNTVIRSLRSNLLPYASNPMQPLSVPFMLP